jgi:hypothetical protein
MIQRPLALMLLCACAALSLGCQARLFDVNLFVVGEQTSLEKQVLGSYNALGENLLVYSSVRGVDPDGELRELPPATDSQRAAFAALRNREYNADDVQAILAAGLAGEGRDALMQWREEDARRIVEEENADREVLLARLMQTTPGAAPTDEAEVRWILAGLNGGAAPAGAWIEGRDGTWRRR